jgi:hypothetical protein
VKESAKYPELAGLVEENIEETLPFYPLPRSEFSSYHPFAERDTV